MSTAFADLMAAADRVTAELDAVDHLARTMTTLGRRGFDAADRDRLYALAPSRAVYLAQLAVRVGFMERAERDGIVHEAHIVGHTGRLKPWAARTPTEKVHGVVRRSREKETP